METSLLTPPQQNTHVTSPPASEGCMNCSFARCGQTGWQEQVGEEGPMLCMPRLRAHGEPTAAGQLADDEACRAESWSIQSSFSSFRCQGIIMGSGRKVSGYLISSMNRHGAVRCSYFKKTEY
ncbi:hypothetical protein I7I51_03107 [Histoplasma capsulatum]|uniref:Uncharacterized protein n=1 Tax=Ajellomyces capsulatus TaxID=5037 RepID=A0A8A1MM41_AJECA|nr:hypothetical protein I7I51_03107 [Histoplasma capsulatum]